MDKKAKVTRKELRKMFPDVVVKISKVNTGRVPHLHIPDPSDEESNMCRHVMDRSKRKDVSVYPEGYTDWCGDCLKDKGLELKE